MPKERESELRHLEGKAFQQMHSSCAKKVPAIHQKKYFEFDVLSDLKKLSHEADQLGEKILAEDPGFEKWFATLKETMISIRNCENVKDIQYPQSIGTFIDMKNKSEKVLSPTSEATPALKIKTYNIKEMTPVVRIIPLSPSKLMSLKAKQKTPCMKSVTSDTQIDQIPETIMQTPILNRTFCKVLNSTAVLDSGSATNSNQQSFATSVCYDSGMKTRSGSKKTVLKDNLSSKKKENACPNNHGMLTRSGSKRKSSDIKNKSNKKQKVDALQISSATLNKTTQSRHPLRDLKSSILASENKAKLSTVIKPPVQLKQPVVPKEKQILEVIKKKEKKVEENLQRIMAERQQKTEQNKKNREEKQTKTLQKRLQMEKKKEEKREIETKKSQAKVNKENPKKTTRTKELIEQHVKESNSLVSISTTQNISNGDAVVKTPTNRKSEDIESYELTPLPDSSSYNFSDDEEEKPSNKRIPLWAQGLHLKSALMQQYYNPVDTDDLFGSIIDTPNLVEIFKINKKRYLKRTSSAIWNSPPTRSFHH